MQKACGYASSGSKGPEGGWAAASPSEQLESPSWRMATRGAARRGSPVGRSWVPAGFRARISSIRMLDDVFAAGGVPGSVDHTGMPRSSITCRRLDPAGCGPSLIHSCPRWTVVGRSAPGAVK